ncbi:MAG TPA: CoA-acylating methylmalonate-semialdehyde dehydrogenase [Gemmatimonadales bacterium]|nr:CoA-acylating methylmalonate-semialdehyde dehydrogenase [Gemmatimonadales bacterium]
MGSSQWTVGSVIPNFVAGHWSSTASTEALPVVNPATGEALGQVPLSTRDDAAAAVAAAVRAFPAWRAVPVVERIQVLFRLKALLERHLDQLAETMTREHGKTRDESAGELKRGIESVTHACAMPTLLMGETLEDIAPGLDCETIRQPLGVFAVITPYNFPVMIPLWFWPFAVATGNTVVLKPSERDPLTHQGVVDLAAQAGLPAGVLNVVHGDQRAVDALLEHPDVVGVSFVGSSPVARAIYAKAAAAGKRVQALGGAKNHMIVLPDADYDATARAVIASVYGAAGQRCLAGSIVVGVGEAYGPVRERVLSGAAELKLGYGLDAGVTMGPVISGPHRERVAGYVASGEREGAKLLLDGRGASVTRYPAGHWFGPTVFEGVRPEMAIGREEIFGPVAGLSRAGSLEEAIALVHRNPYGNAISLFTTSGAAAREFRYRAGISMLGVNIGVVAPMAFFPFGGSRGSFYGDLKAQGRDAIEFYTDKRVVISKW